MIKKLPEHYSMTTPASIYDEEALTALELAGRTTAKVNETVAAFNNLSEETREEITTMKTETIPETVNAEFRENVKNGTFNEMIDKYAGDLSARVDNLVGSTPEGSTTMDAEIIDARLGADRKKYNNLGAAIRQQLTVNGEPLRDILVKQGKNRYNAPKQTPEACDPHYFVEGQPLGNDALTASYECTGKIYLESDTVYTIGLVPAFGVYSLPWGEATSGIHFYDENGQFLGMNAAQTFRTPEGTAYARFNFYTGGGITLPVLNRSCMIVEGYSLPATYTAYDDSTFDENVDNMKRDIAVLKDAIGASYKNLFNPEEQTDETIDPHYYFDGAPYSTTQFDGYYNCTAPIAVKGYTYYTLALVPAINGFVNPWGEVSHGLFFYDKNDTYIGMTLDTTFLTPTDCAYVRFNYAMVSGITLAKLHSNCVFVEGKEIPSEYVPYGDAVVSNVKKMFYRAVADSITVNAHYNTANEISFNLAKKGGNNIFDFNSVGLIENVGVSHVDTVPYAYIVNSSGDWHAPFIVSALNNADGDNPTTKYFTGGNHNHLNTDTGGTPTGRTTVVRFFADGKQCWGTGYANNIRIEWTNRVQAYNTTKADGSGREVLEERHVLTFDGYQWESYVEIEPLEDIRMELFYGLQVFNPSAFYPKVRFIGGKVRGEFDSTDYHYCENKTPLEISCYGDTHKVILGIDTTFDLGKRELATAESGAFTTSYGKAYMHVMDNVNLAKGDVYALRGYYIFKPSHLIPAAVEPEPDEAPVEPDEPTVQGIWVFNDEPAYEELGTISVSFTSNGSTFTGMTFESNKGDLTLYYLPKTTVYEVGSFNNVAYKTIDFGPTEQTVSDNFYTWLTANATQKAG